MQEKDIREELNRELDKMAPDILDKIIEKPIEPVKNERELFGKRGELFREKRILKKSIWIPAALVAAVCIVIIVAALAPTVLNRESTQINTAFSIIVDVNPSISIQVDEEGKVKKVSAENKDAKTIVKKINKKMSGQTDYQDVLVMVIVQLKKSGYIKKEKNVMLVSMMSSEEKLDEETLCAIKDKTIEAIKEKDIKCTTVYQVFELSEEITEVAEKNNVSVGKAALCINLAKEENVSVKSMCKKSIDRLYREVKKSGIASDNQQLIISDTEKEESESVTLETETVFETESLIQETESSTEEMTEETIWQEEQQPTEYVEETVMEESASQQ